RQRGRGSKQRRIQSVLERPPSLTLRVNCGFAAYAFGSPLNDFESRTGADAAPRACLICGRASYNLSRSDVVTVL
ncbi:MAG: hypothetical protein ACKV2Q_21835, partial [Planctomycetaceae bacterium]